jgi:Uma2 family endonuclease
VALTRTRMTLEEFLALPEEKPALEFEDGVVTQKVSPKGRHSVLQYAAAEFVNRSAGRQKLARAFPELRTTFAGASRVPDVAVYAWHRIPRGADGEVADDFSEPPDIAIEIASPGQTRRALVERCRRFVAERVKGSVLVDPDDRSVVVVRPGMEPVTLRPGDVLDLSDVIPGLRIDVRELFDALRDFVS